MPVADNRTRTSTQLPGVDFESTASTIPPYRLLQIVSPHSIKKSKIIMNINLLSADIGATNSRFALFQNLTCKKNVEYKSHEFPSFEALLEKCFSEHPDMFEAAVGTFAFAGIVSKERFPLTNLPWHVDWKKIKEQFGFKELHFLNDLESAAYGVKALPADSIKTLQMGEDQEGTLALISPGTGLGEAFLTREGRAYATESGHADFGPVNELQVELFQYIKLKFGRVSYEHILSGSGITNIYSFLKGDPKRKSGEDIWTGAFKFHDQVCIESLRLFTTILAQEAGNLALHTLAKQGIYIGGGIVPHLLPYLETPAFLDTFCRKGPMTPFLQTIPVKVILDPRTSLFGCAWYTLYGTR